MIEEYADVFLICLSCLALLFASRAAAACCFAFVGTASVVYAWPDASGWQCLMTMSLIWCFAMTIVVRPEMSRTDKHLSICFGLTSLFVGSSAIIDRFAHQSSEFAYQLFVLYPYAMLTAQLIALIIVFYGGFRSIHIHRDSVLGRLLSRREAFYLFGEK